MPSTHLSLPLPSRFQYQEPLTHDHGVTVSPFQIERVKNYVLNQEEHHRRQTFLEEYLEMLRLSAIKYDERFVW